MKDVVGFNANRLIVSLPPCDLPTSTEWGINLASMYWPLHIGREFSSQEGVGKDLDLLHNHLAGYALAVKARYILFLSNSCLPPNWAIHRLVESMKLDPKIMICAGISETNVPESTNFVDSVLRFKDDFGEEFDVLEIAPDERVGFECTLVKVELFDYIEEPWFKSTGIVKSDTYLCNAVIKAGYKVCAHTGVVCGHVDMETGKSHWPTESVITLQKV